MKKAIRSYKPAMGSTLRTVRWAEEVTTGTGIVDSIRFEDYIEEDKSYCIKDKCKYEGKNNIYEKKKCHGCVYKRSEYIIGMLVTCFEMKISKNDFKSKNGHNFIGNHNYYVVPKELYEKIKDLVKDDIGIIVYYPSGQLIKKKECKFKEIDTGIKTQLLYNSLKKWVDDGDRILYFKDCENKLKKLTEKYEQLNNAIYNELKVEEIKKIYEKYDI